MRGARFAIIWIPISWRNIYTQSEHNYCIVTVFISFAITKNDLCIATARVRLGLMFKYCVLLQIVIYLKTITFQLFALINFPACKTSLSPATFHWSACTKKSLKIPNE
jgi:hypothetical protein